MNAATGTYCTHASICADCDCCTVVVDVVVRSVVVVAIGIVVDVEVTVVCFFGALDEQAPTNSPSAPTTATVRTELAEARLLMPS